MTFSFPDSSVGKESACNALDLGSIPELGRSSGEGKGYSPKYSGLENSMDCIVHGGHKSQTRLATFTNHFDHCTNFAPDMKHSTQNLIFPHFPSLFPQRPQEHCLLPLSLISTKVNFELLEMLPIHAFLLGSIESIRLSHGASGLHTFLSFHPVSTLADSLP